MNIEKTTKPAIYQLVIVFVVTIILLMFTTTVFRAIDSIMPWDWSGLTRFARLIVMTAGVIGLLLTWLNAKKETYTLTNNAVIIKRGGVTGRKQDIYNLKNITSLSVRQSFLGNQYNYGNVDIKMDKLEKNSQIKLHNVVSPRTVAEKINAAKSAL